MGLTLGNKVGVGKTVRQGSNSIPSNILMEEDTSYYITEEDSTNYLISED